MKKSWINIVFFFILLGLCPFLLTAQANLSYIFWSIGSQTIMYVKENGGGGVFVIFFFLYSVYSGIFYAISFFSAAICYQNIIVQYY